MPSTGSERDLRVGLVGYGLGGAAFHAPFVAATPGMRLAAIVTRSAERRAEAARAHPGAALVDDAGALWEGPHAVDLVVVASPNATHAPLARAALEAGRHVVVDKPFAPTAAEARSLGALARARGLVLVPFQNRRWDGDFLTVRRLREAGALGEVLRFESRFERWRAEPKPRWTAVDAAANGEGIVHDLGTHLVDQALALLGPARRVFAELDARRAGVTSEDDAFLALTHASGARSRLTMSAAAALSGPRFAVFGSAGAYVKHGLDPQEAALRRGERPGAPGWGEDDESAWGTLAAAGGEARAVRTEPGDYGRFYAGVLAAVREGAPPPVRVAEAAAALAVIEAAFRSAREGRAAAVDATGGADVRDDGESG